MKWDINQKHYFKPASNPGYSQPPFGQLFQLYFKVVMSMVSVFQQNQDQANTKVALKTSNETALSAEKKPNQDWLNLVLIVVLVLVLLQSFKGQLVIAQSNQDHLNLGFLPNPSKYFLNYNRYRFMNGMRCSKVCRRTAKCVNSGWIATKTFQLPPKLQPQHLHYQNA